jgi:hypothetical protein
MCENSLNGRNSAELSLTLLRGLGLGELWKRFIALIIIN